MEIWLILPVKKTISHEKNTITIERIAVTKFEFKLFKPIFAKIDDKEAVNADIKAYKIKKIYCNILTRLQKLC